MASKKPIVIAAGLGILALLLSGKAKASTKPPTCDLGPFKFDTDDVQGFISAAINAGMRNDNTILTLVATAMWATHPEPGEPLRWPVVPGADTYQLCAWKMFQAQLLTLQKEH